MTNKTYFRRETFIYKIIYRIETFYIFEISLPFTFIFRIFTNILYKNMFDYFSSNIWINNIRLIDLS